MQNSTFSITGVQSFRGIAAAFALLVFLPCLLSLIHVTFAQEWKIHFFPAAIFLAAVRFGPVGGLVAGLTGSHYSAILLGNPWLMAGNAILGFFAGFFYRKTSKIVFSVILAFAYQLPWLILSDCYFAGLSPVFIAELAVVLFLGNLMWALLILPGMKPIKKYLC